MIVPWYCVVFFPELKVFIRCKESVISFVRRAIKLFRLDVNIVFSIQSVCGILNFFSVVWACAVRALNNCNVVSVTSTLLWIIQALFDSFHSFKLGHFKIYAFCCHATGAFNHIKITKKVIIYRTVLITLNCLEEAQCIWSTKHNKNQTLWMKMFTIIVDKNQDALSKLVIMDTLTNSKWTWDTASLMDISSAELKGKLVYMEFRYISMHS